MGRKRQDGQSRKALALLFTLENIVNAQVVEAQRVVNTMTGPWRFAPQISVVPTHEQLPVPAPSDANGMIMHDHAYIVANRPVETVIRTIAHEAVGHIAMRQMLKGKWRSFMLAIGAGGSSDASLARLRSYVHDTYTDESGTCNLAAVSVGDEIAAIAAEIWFNAETGKIEAQEPLKAQAAALAGHFAREMLYLDVPVSRTQLQGGLLSAFHMLRYGGPILGLAWRFGRWYSSPMTKPMGPKVPARNLAESERWLASEANSAQAAEDRKAMVSIILAVLGGIGALVGISYWALILLGVVRIF